MVVWAVVVNLHVGMQQQLLYDFTILPPVKFLGGSNPNTPEFFWRGRNNSIISILEIIVSLCLCLHCCLENNSISIVFLLLLLLLLLLSRFSHVLLCAAP